jgi:hypothetical protein
MVLRQVSVFEEYSYGEVQTIEFNVLVNPFKVIVDGDTNIQKKKIENSSKKKLEREDFS